MPHHFKKITHYLVVPIKGLSTERTVTCDYFRKEESEWIPVKANELRSHHKDILCISQPSYEDAVKHKVKDPDPCLHLFAGVAKTRDTTRSMPNLMQVIDGAMIVSIYPSTSRSLILIFQRFTDDSSFGELVATTDPDVHNEPEDI